MSLLETRLAEIALRKQRLRARADAQRGALGEGFRHLDGPAAIVDRGLGIVRFVTAHPVLVVAGVAGIMAFHRKSALSVAGSALSAWRLWSAISAVAGGRSA